MFRSRSWMDVIWNKPKVRLSLEHLKYLHSVLERHTTVSESNRGLLVESLRCIAEILIWGDQNDSSVFDFFLEKNMLLYFLHIMRQKSGGSSFVCVQLLQTLNILFENIRNETSLYYLLSNNHVNSIIVHKFDFSDEDVMGYYILFLKTLSLKLNTHTIHFFYNEHTNDFPLYTEAIKFFNHPESMVRIAVRTISLNVYRVQNTSMLQFIRDKTAAPYFSNLVWFIGKHILELDTCVRNDTDHQSHSRLSNLVAEHLDHLHYLNDILCLDIPDLNAVLTEHLLHKLFVPLYIFSLTPAPPPLSIALVTQNLAAVLNKTVDIDMQEINNPRVSCVVALFLLSLVFLVITHGPLVHSLAWVILNADHNVFKDGAAEVLNAYIERREVVALGFGQPHESLEQSLDTTIMQSSTPPIDTSADNSFQSTSGLSTVRRTSLTSTSTESGYSTAGVAGVPTTSDTRSSSTTVAINNENHQRAASIISKQMEHINITDEEKEKLKEHNSIGVVALNNGNNNVPSAEIISRPFLDMVLSSLDCTENDYISLLGLCLVYALANNKGVNAEWLENILNKSKSSTTIKYKSIIIDRLLQIITLSSQPSCRVRLITLELAIKLFCQLIHLDSTECTLLESHHNVIFSAYNQCMIILRNFYKSEDIFLDLFEDEYNEMVKSVLNVEFLCMDSTILLPPTGTPLTGINFTRRLPCGDVEKARRAIRVFFYIRKLCQAVTYDQEQLLPLTNPNVCVREENVLDLNNSDLIACTVMLRDGSKLRRFLVIDVLQLILVEPDTKRLGWGVAKLVGFLQDVEVVGDREDSRCLHITIHRGGGCTTNLSPILSAKFIFDDHIRCMAAKQRLTKGRSKARQKKMFQIAQLLEIGQQSSGVQTPLSIHGMSSSPIAGGGGGGADGGASGYTNAIFGSGGTKHLLREHRPLFTTVHRVPGFASALRRESLPLGSVVSRIQIGGHREGRRSAENDLVQTTRDTIGGQPVNSSRSREHSKTRLITARSRDGSLRSPRPRSEEIPLEDFRQSRQSSPVPSRIHSNVSSRSNTPSPLISADIVNRTIIMSNISSSSSSNGGNKTIASGHSNNSNILHNLKDVNTQMHSNHSNHSSLNTSINSNNNNNNNNNNINNSSNTSIGGGSNNGNNVKNDQISQKKRSEETSFIATDGKKLNVEIV